MMGKAYKTKQECREDLERFTSPEQPLFEQAGLIATSPVWGALLALRCSLKVIRSYTTENDEFPCQEHQEITNRLLGGMSERMTAFELEMMNVMIDLAWEVNNCECDHCARNQAELEREDKASKAKYN